MLDIKRGPLTLKPNYIIIPCTRTDDAEAWNQIYCDYYKRGYNHIERTKSGGISLVHLRLPAMDVQCNKWGAELLVGDEDGWFRLQFRNGILNDASIDEKATKITGKQSLYKFWDALAEIGINFKDYAIDPEEGKRLKLTIEKPMIALARSSFKNITWEHVNHVDINSSYPAGLKEYHPEFALVLDDWYAKKKAGHKEYKAYLNLMIGTMQSKHCNYKYTDMAKAAIAFNNRKVREMAHYLTQHGSTILLYNTDGIWYYGDSLPKEMQSDELGGWKQDHTDCTFRAKSDGAYEFIEDGKYYPVIRGRTRLDHIKPRSQWVWGDIYQPEAEDISKYGFIEGYGLEVIYEQED